MLFRCHAQTDRHAHATDTAQWLIDTKRRLNIYSSVAFRVHTIVVLRFSDSNPGMVGACEHCTLVSVSFSEMTKLSVPSASSKQENFTSRKCGVVMRSNSSVCLSVNTVRALTSESLDLQTSFSTHRYNFKTPRSVSSVKVMGSKSKFYERK